MPKKRFLVYLAELVDKAKLRQMCELMELSKEEKVLVLDRFCDGLNMDIIASPPYCISIDRQRKLADVLENKVLGWIIDHYAFFNDRQVKKLKHWCEIE